MKKSQPIGSERNILLNKSRVRTVFTPHSPMSTEDHFVGRDEELQSMLDALTTPGLHALLYGERSIGKSSVAYVAAKILERITINTQKLLLEFKQRQERLKIYRKSCCSMDTFATIMSEPLHDCGFDITELDYSHDHSQSGGANIGVSVAGANIRSTHKDASKYSGASVQASSASWVASQIHDKHAVLLVDELDAISSQKERYKLAELCKLLSDSNYHEKSRFKIFMVGIAENSDDLVAGHPSVGRCLKHIKLERMGDEDLKKIIEKGEKELQLTFDADVINSILSISDGFPYFCQLIALKCSEYAILTRVKCVSKDVLSEALLTACKDAEASLQNDYHKATISYNNNDFKTAVLHTAAISASFFSVADISNKLHYYTNDAVNKDQIRRSLSSLATNGGGVLLKVKRGIYKFKDPRMPCYIKMLQKGALSNRHANA